MTRTEIISAINTLKARLEKLSSDDKADGWTEANRTDVLHYFQNVQHDLQSGLNIAFFSLVRALDGMGINKGELLEEVCKINNAINGLKR